MEELQFWKAVVMDQDNFLERLVTLLSENQIPYCVIGGVAINAYSDPVVTLDLDLVIAIAELGRAEDLLSQSFNIKRFPFSLKISSPNSRLRVQIQLDPRYAEFVTNASPQKVLNLVLPVAHPRDLLKGKLWAYQDPERRPQKHYKDFSDMARLVEAYPELRQDLPPDILAGLIAARLLAP